jgi:hypothetical protein
MSDETVTKWRCSRCQRTFDEPHQADKHDHAGPGEAQIREIEVEPAPETRATSLTDWAQRGDQ